jgi:hypothetical protein
MKKLLLFLAVVCVPVFADETNLLTKIQKYDEPTALEKLPKNMEAIQSYRDFYKDTITVIFEITSTMKREYRNLKPIEQSKADIALARADSLILQATEALDFFDACISLYTAYKNGDTTISLPTIITLANTAVDKIDNFSRSFDTWLH